MTSAQQRLPVVLAVATLIAAVVFVATNVIEAGGAPTGPVEVAWDREVCAHCRMHVGAPAFAAQVQCADGRVLNFDDPGCAFEHIDAARLDVRAAYFHHYRESRWLPAADTAFIEVAQSPMGFGFGAVDAGTAAAIPLAEARSHMLRRK